MVANFCQLIIDDKGSFAEDFFCISPSCGVVNPVVFLSTYNQLKFVVPGGCQLVNGISCQTFRNSTSKCTKTHANMTARQVY